jgi:signal transduction histidine kinase
MKRRLRKSSLFWTFAGAFMLVLIVTALVHALMLDAVLRPIAERMLESRVESTARDAAAEIATALADDPDADLQPMLRTLVEERGPIRIYFRHRDGWFASDRPVPPGRRRPPWMFREPFADTAGDLPPHGLRPREERDGDRRAMSREPVRIDTTVVGEVVAFAQLRRFPHIPSGSPVPALFFLPVSIIIAGAAGLVIFRLVLRRLRRLEDLATRVTEGDLDARVPSPGSDEIGRLGDRLNRMTASLAEAKQRVEHSDRQRRQLLADISHELATPLTSIRGYTETLLDPSMTLSDDERASYLRHVLDESERMDLLIQDLLELTRLEAGASDLNKERLDWAALCRNTIERFRPRFDNAGVSIRWDGPAEEAWLEADGRRLEQVLENLLVNALRYVPQDGTVSLTLEAVTDDDTKRFRLTIIDDGPGFPPEDLPHVFDRFYRGDPARSTGGSGLGLAIVQEIVRRHNGAVRADNRTPSGAAIIIELPARG